MIADAATMEKINQTISKAKNDVKELIKQAHDKQLEAEAGRTMMESFENKVNQVVVCLLDLEYVLLLILWVFQSKKSIIHLSSVVNFSFLSRFSTRLVMMLEAVLKIVYLKATI